MKTAFLFTCYNRIEKTRACVKSLIAAINYAENKGMTIEDEWYITDAGSSDDTVMMLGEEINLKRGRDGAMVIYDGEDVTGGINEDCGNGHDSGEDYSINISVGDQSDAEENNYIKFIHQSNLHICAATNDTFYSQGMRKSMEMLLSDDSEGKLGNDGDGAYVILINDDVAFYEDFLYRMLKETSHSTKAVNGNSDADSSSTFSHPRVLVGATDYNGCQTYGGVRYLNTKSGIRRTILPQSISYKTVSIDDNDRKCHTFNANCVLIPMQIIRSVGLMDEKYIHSLGDFDYGMCIYEKKIAEIESTAYYVGSCPNNIREGTWMDRNLSRCERLKRLRSIKGAPTGPWFYYLNKHFGFTTAIVHSLSPYVRILLGK